MATTCLLALGDDLGAGRWSVRVQIRPLMSLRVARRSDHGDRRVSWRPSTGATAAPGRWSQPRGDPRSPRRPDMKRFSGAARAACRCLPCWRWCYRSVSAIAPDKGIIVSPLLGKPAPQFALPALLDAGAHRAVRRIATRPLVPGQRVGHLVRRVPRRTRRCCCGSRSTARVPIIGLDWKDDDAQAQAWLTQLGNPYERVGGRSRRTRRHRLGRLRRAGELSDQSARASSSTSTSARSPRNLDARDPAARAGRQVRCARCWKCDWQPDCMLVAPGRGRARQRTPLPDPALQAALPGADPRAALHAMPERVNRRLAGGPGGGSAPRGARAAARRPIR